MHSDPTGIFLGIDGGGTNTRAVIIDTSNNILGTGIGGPCNIIVTPESILQKSIADAVGEAALAANLPQSDYSFTAICAGVAGYSAERKREEFRASIQTWISGSKYLINPDYEIAYWGATHGEPGIVVIAGTGAAAYGRNLEGKDFVADGLGYLLGDRGSGFDLGLYALRHTLEKMQAKSLDDLAHAVLTHTGASRETEVIQWLYGNFSPARVASLSPVIGQLAEAGDSAARKLVSEMAKRLRHTVREVRHQLWLNRDTAIYPLGGLWQLGEFFRSEFRLPVWKLDGELSPEEQDGSGGYFNVAEPVSDAAFGAALLASRSL